MKGSVVVVVVLLEELVFPISFPEGGVASFPVLFDELWSDVHALECSSVVTLNYGEEGVEELCFGWRRVGLLSKSTKFSPLAVEVELVGGLVGVEMAVVPLNKVSVVALEVDGELLEGHMEGW